MLTEIVDRGVQQERARQKAYVVVDLKYGFAAEIGAVRPDIRPRRQPAAAAGATAGTDAGTLPPQLVGPFVACSPVHHTLLMLNLA